MAFSFGNNATSNPFGAASQNTAPQGQTGPDLEDIQTEALGFLTIADEAVVQLLPTPWPQDSLPPPTSSLLSIASRRGLIAAAGPDVVVIASTEQARNAFATPKNGDTPRRSFQPQLTLPMPMRISQVAFTADEDHLILAAETGGGLAVYEVQALLNGSTESTFQLSTQSIALKALVPNPTQEKGELVAVVLSDGKLMIANLKERQFVAGNNGQVLRDGVTCASWSTRGKQLVAGLQNGTAIQMTPDGAEKAVIPEPPGAGGSHFLASIVWLENNVFLAVHTPSSFGDQPPSSIFHVVTRKPPAEFVFQKIAEPAGPFGMNRSPPNHFLLRLKDFPPNLQDLLIVASTASTDIGLFSRSKVALASDKSSDQITGVFTMTEMADDTRRAQLPANDNQDDTSPIGLALDLSSTNKVLKPIPGDEMEESQTPLPALMVLNNEGVLAAWWVVYSESVRQGTVYPELTVAGPSSQQQQTSAPTQSAFGGSVPSALAAPAFSSPAVSKTAAPSFGAGSAFGAAPAFGAGSGLGKSGSVWGSPSTAGSKIPVPAGGVFGSTATFGSTSTAGSSASPFGASAKSSNNVFGGSAPTTGFASFAQQGGSGFASTANNTSNGQSSFGGFNTSTANEKSDKPSGFSFGATQDQAASFGNKPVASQGFSFGGAPQSNSPANGSGIFGQQMTDSSKAGSVFGQPQPSSSSSIFGTPSNNTPAFGSQPFTLGSTFKPDSSAKNDALSSTQAASGTGVGLLGNDFASALTSSVEQTTNDSLEADMEESEPPVSTTPPVKQTNTLGGFSFGNNAKPAPATTNTSTSLFGVPTSSKPSESPFSFGAAAKPTPPTTETKPSLFEMPKPTKPSSLFEMPKPNKPSSPFTLPNPSAATSKPAEITQEKTKPESALPPLSTSKSTPPSVDESLPSSPGGASDDGGTDAPLPPDFLIKPPAKKDEAKPAPKDSFSTVFSNPKAFSDNGPPGLFSNLKPVSEDSSVTEQSGTEPEDEAEDHALPQTDDEEEESAEEEVERDDAHDLDSDNGEFQTEEEDGEENEFDGSGEDVADDLSAKSSDDGQQTTSTHSFTTIAKPSSPSTKPSTRYSTKGAEKKSSSDKVGAFSFASPSVPLKNKPAPRTSLAKSPDKIFGSAIPRRASNATKEIPKPSTMQGNRRGSGYAVVPPRGLKKPTGQPSSTYVKTLEQKQAEERQHEEARAKREAEEAQALVDDEDESMQRYLNAPLEPTKILDEFTAHQDYNAITEKNSTPAQIESVFRDINSMIDNLGLNARALKSFIAGHEKVEAEHRRHRQDLEDDEDWCLVEVSDLGSIITQDLTDQLEDGRVTDISGKIEQCEHVEKELSLLATKTEQLNTLISTQSENDVQAAHKTQPLTPEQAAMQNDLRRDYTTFQQKLVEAEEALTILRAKITSEAGHNSKAPVGPTMEAVTRTIIKMTSMAEKRSGDVDVLEAQMRNLRMGSQAPSQSREASPFATPNHKMSLLRASGSGLVSSWNASARESTPSRFGESVMSSMSAGHGSPARKKMSGFTQEEKMLLRSKGVQRQHVKDRLRAALQERGGRVRLMDEDDDIE